jgi:hypothetical protein
MADSQENTQMTLIVRLRMLAACLLSLQFFTQCADVRAEEACPANTNRLTSGEPCIPLRLFTYLYCLKNSGGGRVEVHELDDKDRGKTFEIVLNGKGSGVIIKGEGAGTFKSTEADRAIHDVSAKMDATLVERCERQAREISLTDITPPPSKWWEKTDSNRWDWIQNAINNDCRPSDPSGIKLDIANGQTKAHDYQITLRCRQDNTSAHWVVQPSVVSTSVTSYGQNDSQYSKDLGIIFGSQGNTILRATRDR